MKRSPIQRYSLAILSTLLALLLTKLLWWQLQPAVYPFFLSAVAISSWYGGVRPALLSIALSALASEYFFLPPIYTLAVSQHSLMRIGYFALVGLIITVLNAMLRSAQRQAQSARALLQQNQETLRQSEERYRLMVEKLRGYAIFMLDPNGYIVNWNVGAERIFGYQEQEIVGQLWDCLFTPEALERSVPKQALKTAVANGVSNDDRWHVRKNGTLFWANGLVTPLRDRNGNLCGFTKILQDLTQRKQAEEEREQLLGREQAARAEAEAANRAKDEFLAIVSHELRTPMTAIVGWAGMLEAGKLDELRAAVAVETIARNANLQMQLIDDLLDISRIIRGELSLNCDNVELARVITSALEIVQPQASAKEISLHFYRDLSDRLPLIVWGDSNRLQQVMGNLLVNAIKFTPDGGRVEIRLDKGKNTTPEITNFARIQVIDTGIGISPDFLPFVFDRFRQANSASNRTHKGLGLGLAIARHLVELHGGTIEAASQGIGQGATFTILLPLMNAVAKTEPTKEDGGEFATRPLALDCLQILVVDDEVDARILLSTWLEEYGAEVTLVSSVDEAIAVLERSLPDILISDLGMPDKDGYVLIDRVKQIETEKGVKIKAIALTAYAREEDRRRAIESGFQMYLTKPVDINELIAAIASLAQSSQ